MRDLTLEEVPDHLRTYFEEVAPVVIAHPTVKPRALMAWLVRLVTPPGGTVLDPFSGTGTTLDAARSEGFPSVGIERDPDYRRLIQARLEKHTPAA